MCVCGGGGGEGPGPTGLPENSSDKGYFFIIIFSPQLIFSFTVVYQWFISFPRFQRGSNIFQGGGGSNIVCVIFQGEGGPDPLSPPIDPHMSR